VISRELGFKKNFTDRQDCFYFKWEKKSSTINAWKLRFYNRINISWRKNTVSTKNAFENRDQKRACV